MAARAGDDFRRGEHTGRLLRLLAASVVVNGMLLAPAWILSGSLGPPVLAVEAVLLPAAFALLPAGRKTFYFAVGLAATVLLIALAGVGDAGLRLALGRPLNLSLDFWLLRSVWDLLVGSLGLVPAFAVAAITPVLVIGVVVLIATLLTPAATQRKSPLHRARPAVPVVALPIAVLVAATVPGLKRYVDEPAVRLVVEQTRAFVALSGERERFAEALEEVPGSYAAVPGLLSRLAERDVILGFIESYGVSALYDPRYSPVVGPRLDDLEARMRAADLHIVTGTLVAPTRGGQSWFSHGSLLSGLWLDSQPRYEMMLASGRETLIDDFHRAGHVTVAVMPAITKPWPEGARFDYDQIFVRKDIRYEGPPLNWVTMPDQFTWSFVQESILDKRVEPALVEIGLISSHAPWTPILEVLDDWGDIRDGAVFTRWEGAGERPEELWLDTERVREHYALSVEYAVHAMAAYAEQYVDDSTLLIALGDHQPAPLVTGEGASWSVPVHVISGDPELLEPFLEWGFVEGAWPDPERESLGMDYFRDWFVRAYSAP